MQRAVVCTRQIFRLVARGRFGEATCPTASAIIVDGASASVLGKLLSSSSPNHFLEKERLRQTRWILAGCRAL